MRKEMKNTIMIIALFVVFAIVALVLSYNSDPYVAGFVGTIAIVMVPIIFAIHKGGSDA